MATSSNTGDGEEEEDEGLAKDEEATVIPEQLQSAHAQIVDYMLKSVSADAIGQVTKVVFELQRISLLWDELWLGRLQQYRYANLAGNNFLCIFDMYLVVVKLIFLTFCCRPYQLDLASCFWKFL